MKTIHTVTLNPAVDKTVTVEHFAPGELNRIKTMRTDAGGKGINVAKVLHSFSVPVIAWGIQGGHQGKIILDKLSEQGIPSRFIEAEGETRTNLKVVDEHTKQTTELNEAGCVPSREHLEQFLACYEAGLDEAAIVVLGGSLPPGTPADYYRRLIEIANRKGCERFWMLTERLWPAESKPCLLPLSPTFMSWRRYLERNSRARNKLYQQQEVWLAKACLMSWYPWEARARFWLRKRKRIAQGHSRLHRLARLGRGIRWSLRWHTVCLTARQPRRWHVGPQRRVRSPHPNQEPMSVRWIKWRNRLTGSKSNR